MIVKRVYGLDPIERMKQKYIVNPVTNCWEWQANRYYNGYGHINVDKKTLFVHRYSYEYYFGSFDKSLCVLHKCDNRKCINPDHLFLGTRDENMKDMVSKNRQAKGIDNGTNKLSEIDVIEIKKTLSEKIYKGLITQLSKKYKVSRAVIYDIKNGKSWSHIQIP